MVGLLKPKPGRSPLVSIVVRTHNREKLLQRCLQSINAQTYPHLEVVVVNDGGRDVLSIVQTLRFPYTYIRHAHTIGKGYSLNVGLRRAAGDYVNFVDDDDLIYPRHIATLVDAILRTGAPVVYTDSVLRTEQLIDGEWQAMKHELQYSQDYDAQLLLTTNYLPILNVLFRKELAELAGGVNEHFPVLEDWDFWIRLSLLVDFTHVPQVTAEYSLRIDGDNSTHLEFDQFAVIRDRIYEAYERYRT